MMRETSQQKLNGRLGIFSIPSLCELRVCQARTGSARNTQYCMRSAFVKGEKQIQRTKKQNDDDVLTSVFFGWAFLFRHHNVFGNQMAVGCH